MEQFSCIISILASVCDCAMCNWNIKVRCMLAPPGASKIIRSDHWCLCRGVGSFIPQQLSSSLLLYIFIGFHSAQYGFVPTFSVPIKKKKKFLSRRPVHSFKTVCVSSCFITKCLYNKTKIHKIAISFKGHGDSHKFNSIISQNRHF